MEHPRVPLAPVRPLMSIARNSLVNRTRASLPKGWTDAPRRTQHVDNSGGIVVDLRMPSNSTPQAGKRHLGESSSAAMSTSRPTRPAVASGRSSVASPWAIKQQTANSRRPCLDLRKSRAKKLCPSALSRRKWPRRREEAAKRIPETSTPDFETPGKARNSSCPVPCLQTVRAPRSSREDSPT